MIEVRTLSFTWVRKKKPSSASMAQNAKGAPGNQLARLLPMGGAKVEPMALSAMVKPVAVPAYWLPTPRVSMTIVKKIAMAASRAKPARNTANHTRLPLTNDKRPVPRAIIREAMINKPLREPSLSDQRAMGRTKRRLTE